MNDVFWINGGRSAYLAIVLRPRGGDWLEEELRRMRRSGIETLISMLEPAEAAFLGLENEEAAAGQAGLNFLSYPIPDTQVPEDVTGFRQFVAKVAERLNQGEHIGVHCRGCIGRATILSACTLIHLGWHPSDALAAIEKARGMVVPDTPEQATWILGYRV